MLEVLDAPSSTTRYVDQVVSDLPDWVDVEYFTWRRGLTARYDVLHVHWPEHLVRDKTWLRTAAKQVACAALLVRLKVLRVALVRTEHNPEPHERGGAVERALIGWMRATTTVVIRLNRSTPVDGRHPNMLIPHGHYDAAFSGIPRPAMIPGRFLYFGIVREYKGVERLLEVFGSVVDPQATLRVVGETSEPRLRDVITRKCREDARISARLEPVPDAVLVHEVTEAELVVLPYRKMHNSGVVLAALTLARPVLVPRSAVNEELAAEVGEGWIHQYEGELTAETLVRALTDIRVNVRSRDPRFVDRDWGTIGRLHGEAYRGAAARARRGVRHRHGLTE